MPLQHFLFFFRPSFSFQTFDSHLTLEHLGIQTSWWSTQWLQQVLQNKPKSSPLQHRADSWYDVFVLNAVFGLWCSTLWSYISALILSVQRPLLQKTWCCYICSSYVGVFWSELGMYFQCMSHSWENCGIVLAFTEVLTLAVTCIWLLDSSCNLLIHLIPIEAITVYLIFHMTAHTVCGPEKSQSFCMWLANFATVMQFCHLYCP